MVAGRFIFSSISIAVVLSAATLIAQADSLTVKTAEGKVHGKLLNPEGSRISRHSLRGPTRR